MGIISITITGSFPVTGSQSFSAEEGGHANATQRAIAYLNDQLRESIQVDHELHNKGEFPPKALFGEGGYPKVLGEPPRNR